MNQITFVPIVELLRAELAGYGGLLALFDEQQSQLWRREVQTVAETSLAIEQLAAEIARDREAREAWVTRFASAHDQPADTSLRRLLPFFPTDQQPLIGALIDEINHLLHRVRRRAHQNRSILARAVELHHDVIASLHPAGRPRTYAPSGRVGHITGPASTLRATG
ncbi:MAG: flagellar protein FlgN [Opitutaceae bacterium]|jgi:flagellar biosynthesis/type III secretory pathway chaperone